MIDTLVFLTEEFSASFLSFIDSLMFAPGVSLLGFFVAIILLTIIVGAILIRV